MKTVISHLPKERRRQVIGVVVSDKMEKTIVVRVDRRALHSLFRKYVTLSKRFKVHDQDQLAKIGDTVRIIESRPISKDKKWRLSQILESSDMQRGDA